MTTVRGRRPAALVAGLVLAGVLLAACSSGTTPSTTTTTAASGTVAAVKAAVTGFLTGQGVQSFKYVITKAEVSSVDPTWAYFFVGAAKAHQADFQSFYGFAEETGGSWKVVASGSAEVGCPPGATGNAVVPTAVQSEFGLSCPPATTTSTTAPPATTTTTTPQSALTAAVVAFQTSQGVPQSSYQISKLTVSTVQPTWAIFSVGPTTATKATFQGGYGFLHLVNGTWSVVAFGSAEVGCPGGSPSTQVPTAVLSGFGQSCPTTATTTTTTTS